MSVTPIITEGLQKTSRLQLYALHAIPGVQKAPKVLLLGGSNFDLRLKRTFLDTTLVSTCEVATYEPRGLGRSDQPDGAWTMNDYAMDALAFLDALNWKEVTVVGESFGGMTALHLALLVPQRIKCMIISSATAGGPRLGSYDISRLLELNPKQAARKALYIQDSRNYDLSEEDPELFSQRLLERISLDEEFASPSRVSGGYARLLTARRRHDCTQRLHDIKTPTTIIAGRYDVQAPYESQQALANALPHSTFHPFDGGHGLLFGLPAATQVAVSSIL